jgi:outer membrane protein assembly factor BamB
VTNTLRTAALIIAAMAVAGCGVFSGKDDDELKPMKLESIKETVKVRKTWSAKLGGGTESLRLALRPTGDGNRIYAASYDGKVSAFDPESGKLAWRTDLDLELSAGPGVGEGFVAIVSRDDVDAESLARPLIKDEIVVIKSIDNRLQAFSLFDGRPRWSLQQSTPSLTMRGSSSPVAIGSTVIAGFDSGRLVAAELETGTVVWEGMLSPPKGRSDLDRLSDIDGELAVVGQDIYATGYHGRLAAMASESGQVLWSREVSSYEGVAADWNSLYTVRDDGEVIALALRNGAETWRNASLLRREPTLPAPFGTTVVVGDFEGYIHFFSTIDGEPVARKKLGGSAISSGPFVIGNRLYVQSDSGELGCFIIVDERPRRSESDTSDGT